MFILMMMTLHPFILGSTRSMFSSLCGLSNRQSRPLLPAQKLVIKEGQNFPLLSLIFMWHFVTLRSGHGWVWCCLTGTAMNLSLFFGLLLLLLLLEQNYRILYQGPWKGRKDTIRFIILCFCHNSRLCDLFPLIQRDFQTVTSFWTFPET